MLCRWVCSSQRLKRSRTWREGHCDPWNIRNFLPSDTGFHPRRLESFFLLFGMEAETVKMRENSSHFCQQGNLNLWRQKSAAELQRGKQINLWNRLVKHKVWKMFMYEMGISKQSKIEKNLWCSEWNRWCRQLTSLLIIDNYIWDKLADKIDKALSEVGDAGGWIHYWWLIAAFEISWLIKLTRHWVK
jgi:hypothetical protein